MYSLEEFDELKTKVVKYITYKKRTEQEIKRKFQNIDGNLLNDVIDYLKGIDYINDASYIEKIVNEFIKLNHLSQKELRYKLYSKGLDNGLIENYFSQNQEELYDYEIESAKVLFMKKSNTMEPQEIKDYLTKKGYTKDAIRDAIKE